MWSAWRRIHAAARLFVFFLSIGPKSGRAVRCYCTDDNCASYGVCEADVCVVGLLKVNNAVIRTCGNEPLGCQHNVGKWMDVCACTESFCNTFSYLRASSNRDRVREQELIDDDLVFHRMDRPYDLSTEFDDPSQYYYIVRRNTSVLTILIVVVPLSVGFATVLVVSFNYYCHLC